MKPIHYVGSWPGGDKFPKTVCGWYWKPKNKQVTNIPAQVTCQHCIKTLVRQGKLP